jgi:thioredoxin-related protein
VKASTFLKDKIEIATNILIVMVLLIIGGTYVKSHVGRRNAGLSPGENISAPHGYDWHNHDQTLVIAVRQGCIYCERSYPLYRRLDGLEHDSRLKAHMLIVMPDDSANGTALLKAQGLTSQNVPNTPLGDIKVSGTPTLLLVDANGRLLQSWVGELDASKAEALVAQLRR